MALPTLLSCYNKAAVVVAEAERQLRDPRNNNRVWIPDWTTRFKSELGDLRSFLEKQPDRFLVTRGEGRRFTVKLAPKGKGPGKKGTTKEPEGTQDLRYTGTLKFYNPRMGFGYVAIDPGFQLNEGMNTEFRVDRSEVNAGGRQPTWMSNIQVEFGIKKTQKGTYKELHY